MGIGGITHTLNPRLADSDISYIANHGEDKLILVDGTLLPVVARIAKDLPLLQAVIVLTDRCGIAASSVSCMLLRHRCISLLLMRCTGILGFMLTYTFQTFVHVLMSMTLSSSYCMR
jgi:hypothetical protein